MSRRLTALHPIHEPPPRCFQTCAPLILILLALLALSVLPVAQAPADAPPVPRPTVEGADLPEGFSDMVLATGLTGATAMAVAPDGRMFVCEQTGTLRVIKEDKLLPEPFLAVEVDSYWERGLIGLCLDPDFPTKPFVYVCYVVAKPFPHHRVSRFTARGDVAVAGSEVVLLQGDDQTRLGGSIPAGHQGGAIHFGKDGKLYVGIGEQTAGSPAQRLDTFQGKLLRINSDGSIPEDNPFYKTAKGKYRAIWALGLRNPFAFAVQPGTGRIFINDVGNARLEEINDGAAGANYGWPLAEGPAADPRFKDPLHAYDRSVGRSITGGAFYNPRAVQFPREYVGKYFFADYMDNWVRVLDPNHPEAVSVFATGLAGPVDLQVGPDGSLYYLNRNVWVKDDHFRPKTGSVHRICYAARAGRPVPRLIAQPADVVVAEGQPVAFRAAAEGAGPLTYRWQRNGEHIPGAEAPNYRLDTVNGTLDGAYFQCVVSNRLGSTRSRRAALRVLKLRPAEAPGPVVTGLEYRFYEGRWTSLPDFGALRPAKATALTRLELPSDGWPQGGGHAFQGFLHVPTDGVYTFTLSASGTAKLFLGATEVAATVGNPRASGVIALRAGKHPLLVLYAPGQGPASLEVRCGGAGQDVLPIPEGWLFRTDGKALAAPVISPNGGIYTGPVEVRLTTTTSDAIIRYTTDGSEPTGDSPVYRGPFRLERSALIRARVFRGGTATQSAAARFIIDGRTPYGLARRGLVTTLAVPPDPAGLPLLLSQTGIFLSLKDLTPNPGILPYEVNSPLWSDGALKRRWIALPGDERIGFRPTGEWRFPAGTVFIKHFELGAPDSRPAERRRLETRLLVVRRDGGYGVTYRWRPDGSDADLLDSGGLTEDVPVPLSAGPGVQKWTYPSRNDCLVCHTGSAGFVLGVSTRQLNGPCEYGATTDNQLRTWNHLGLFDSPLPEADIPRLPRLTALGDGAASLELRARSYLDANCAQCHRPGGARGLFDARFDTPLPRQNLINGPVAAADLGAHDPRLIAPGDPARSMIYQRLLRRKDVFNMPPLASAEVDHAAARLVAEWIKSLGAKP